MSIELYQGDCLEVMRSIPDGSVDAVITDPPYGINTKSDGMGKLDPWSDWCNAAYWYSAWIAECRRILKPAGSLWSCLNWRSIVTFQKASCTLGWPIESLLVWDKRWIGPGGTKGLRPSYELVAIWSMPSFSIPNRSLADIQPFPWSSHKPHGHPAEKPIGLFHWIASKAIQLSPGSLVLDPFMGSGTAGAAAVMCDCRFIGIEQNPIYFAIAERRIADEQAKLALIPA